MGALGSTAATIVLLVFLVPTIAVFVISYRHALHTWLAPREATLPVATVIAAAGGTRARPSQFSLAQRFHATIIATAFASVFTMILIALALVATAIAGT